MINGNKIKSVFIATPQWFPMNPPYSLVPIVSYLRANHYDTKILDFNIDYYLSVLNKSYLLESIDKASSLLPELFNYLRERYKKGTNQNDYDNEFKAKLLKYNKIKTYTQEKLQQVKEAVNKIEYSISVMRDKELFYNPQELTKTMANIDFCLEIASLPYFPAQIQMGNYSDPFFKLDFKDMVHQAKTDNMFSSFFKSNFKRITDLAPDFVGISVNSTTQIVSALTLAMMLKKNTNIIVSIGGNFFSRVVDTLEKYPEFFELFCDYVSTEEGEIPTLKLFEYLSGDIGIEDVPNLVYLKDKKVIVNPDGHPLEMNEQPYTDMSDFDLTKYLTPDIVLPQQSSRGCYWGKCSFCDHDFGQKLSLKKEDKFVSELEYVVNKYGINHFEMIDECISPSYLQKMSQKIKEKNLNIFWFNNARLEKAFEPNILKEAYEAGCRMLLWGFESGSKKIMKYINKGIDIDKRTEILTNSRNAGIWNFAFIFFGFPSETQDDAQETIDYIKTHTDIISSYGRSVFTLGKHTTLRANPEQFSITKIYKDIEEFSPTYHFETSVGMNEKEIAKMAEHCLQECNKAYGNPLWMYLLYREVLFLYICKYGADKVETMSLHS